MKTSFLKNALVTILIIANFVACQKPTGTQAVLPDTPENRTKLADKYISLVPMSKMMEETGEEIQKQMHPEYVESFKAYWETAITEENIKTMTDAAKTSLAKHMTTEELTAFIQFMENPAGKKAMDKMKYYMADIMPMTQQIVMKSLAEFEQKMQQEQKPTPAPKTEPTPAPKKK